MELAQLPVAAVGAQHAAPLRWREGKGMGVGEDGSGGGWERGRMGVKERLVVIGGDAAGMSAASQARRRRPDLEIVVFERSPHTSYAA